jgi:preprotein translocase subunit SecD
MKIINYYAIALLIALLTCCSTEKGNIPKVNFGVYETFNVNEIPSSLMDSLKTTNIQFEKNQQQPTIGYLPKDETLEVADLQNKDLKLMKTKNLVEKEGKYYAIAALRPTPALDNSDIQKTKVTGMGVEIHFNLRGANKWAEMTKNRTGKTVAFVIDEQIYAMPYVNGEIRNGMAIITGLENDSIAKALSESLNASIPE